MCWFGIRLLLGAVCLFSCLARSAPARAEDCLAHLEVSGDEPLSGEIAQKLASRNGLGDNSESCERTVVHVERNDAGIELKMVDSSGIRRTGTVAGFEGAVAMLESWMERSLTEKLLFPYPGEAQVVGDATGNPGETEPRDDENPFADEEDAQDEVEEEGGPVDQEKPDMWVTARMEVMGGFDSTFWLGAYAGGCKRLGPTCLGVAARYGHDTQDYGPSSRYSTKRNGLDALVTLALPLEWRHVIIWPAIALGVGWLWLKKEEYINGPDILEERDFGGRADLQLRLIVKLPKGFSVEVGGSSGWSFGGHTETKTKGDLTYVVNPVGFGRGHFGLNYAW